MHFLETASIQGIQYERDVHMGDHTCDIRNGNKWSGMQAGGVWNFHNLVQVAIYLLSRNY